MGCPKNFVIPNASGYEWSSEGHRMSWKQNWRTTFANQDLTFSLEALFQPAFGSSMAAKMTQEASSSSSSMARWSYSVFLSFRGEDTRNNFTRHLYAALRKKEINTFIDDDELRRGEEIASELLKAIEQSRIAIIVFSKNYATSKWCLDELVKILECKKVMGQTVLPVFYKVDPSDVRKQSGSFADAFAEHEKRFKEETKKVERWKAALTEAANLSGWHFNVAKGHQSKFINDIVEKVIIRLNHTSLDVAIYPIGVDSRVQDINLLLNVRSNDVRFVGIYGMGGIGKTTIAKAVYNLIFHKFDGSSFLADVRDVSEKNGLVHLQEKLLCDVLMKKELKISSKHRGIKEIKDRLGCRRILLVLDDVNQFDQLNALAGKRDWFGLGSRIIITTRDKHLLENFEEYDKYKAKEMDHDESLQLFSWHAFGQDHPIEDYVEDSNTMVRYTGGLPLALEVMGSFLLDKRTKSEWRSTLEKLQKIPNDHIQEKLKISYDELDRIQQTIFLDIACFFIGMDKEYVIRILDACDLFPNIEISVLVHKSLVKIDGNKLRMHDLLRDMGREIVHQECPEEPGERSRLWLPEDVYDVLTKHTGTKKVQGLVLNLPRLEGVPLRIEAFAKMENLRLLQVDNVQLTGGYGQLFKEFFPSLGEKHLFSKLRWLCWHRFNMEFIPINFHPENLVILDMQNSNIRQVWKGIKLLKKLKVLNLSHSHCLTITPDFSGLPSLERLMLEDCINLTEVHQSIGHLHKLVFLCLKDCRNLHNLPSSICALKSLENLILSGCSKLVELPRDLGNMDHLIELLADGTAIKQLPFSIRLLENLERLSLRGCTRSPSISWISFFWSMGSLRKTPDSITPLLASFSGLCSLKFLTLSECNLSEGAIPSDFGSLCSLQELDLTNNNFSSLPSSISCLTRLQVLQLRNCTKLQSLPELPSSLKSLNANGCKSMEGLSNIGSASSLQSLDLANNNFCSLPSTINHLSGLQFLTLSNCPRIQSLPELPSSLKSLYADNCTSMERLLNLSNFNYLQAVMLNNCNKLIEIQGLEALQSLPTIHMERCNNLANTFRNSLFQRMSERGIFDIFVPGSEIPEWFSHQSTGSSISVEVRPVWGSQILGLIIYAVYSAKKESNADMTGPKVEFSDKTKGLDWSYRPKINSISVTNEDHMWVSNIPHVVLGNRLEGMDQLEVSIKMKKPVEVKRCGIHLVWTSSENAYKSNSRAMFWNFDRLRSHKGIMRLM